MTLNTRRVPRHGCDDKSPKRRRGGVFAVNRIVVNAIGRSYVGAD